MDTSHSSVGATTSMISFAMSACKLDDGNRNNEDTGRQSTIRIVPTNMPAILITRPTASSVYAGKSFGWENFPVLQCNSESSIGGG